MLTVVGSNCDNVLLLATQVSTTVGNSLSDSGQPVYVQVCILYIRVHLYFSFEENTFWDLAMSTEQGTAPLTNNPLHQM